MEALADKIILVRIQWLTHTAAPPLGNHTERCISQPVICAYVCTSVFCCVNTRTFIFRQSIKVGDRTDQNLKIKQEENLKFSHVDRGGVAFI